VISRYGTKDKELRVQSANLVRLVVDFPYMTMRRALEVDFSAESLMIDARRRMKKMSTATKLKNAFKFNKLGGMSSDDIGAIN